MGNLKARQDWLASCGLDGVIPHSLMAHLIQESYPARELLLHNGADLNRLLFFLSGRARVFRELDNGSSITFRFYDAGDVIGDLEFFTRESITASVSSVSELHIFSLSYEGIDRCRDDISPLLRFLGKSVALKMKANSLAISLNSFYTLEERLLAYLAYQNRMDEQSLSGKYLPGNLGELAEILGCSYRHLHRVLKRFEEEGLVRRTRKGLKILDRKRLGDVDIENLFPA